MRRLKVIVVANTSWYLQNFRLPFVKELQARDIEVVALAPEDDWSDRFKNLGIRFIEIPMDRRGLNPLSDLGLLLRFYRIYRNERPDYILHNTIKPVVYGSLAAGFAGVKHILNMVPGLGYVFTGNTPAHRLLRPLVKLMYRVALRDSYRVFFQNADDKNYFVKMGLVHEEKTQVTSGSGVDLDHFRYMEPSGKPGECTFILVGRMLLDKGVGEFVKAAAEVKRTSPGARFILLGRVDPDNPSSIGKSEIDQWVRSGWVEYLGELDDVRPVVEMADVAVLPSYREGVPKSLLEAMAMGKPIITTDAPGCRETVVDGLNGLMIPPRDASALAGAIRFMIAHPERRVEMGKESRKIAVERFDVKRVNSMILEAMSIS